MKKIITALLFGFVLVSPAFLSSANSREETTVFTNGEVAVYYFHLTRRCMTCQAVEAVSKEAVKEFYGDKVAFEAYNIEEETGEKKGDELGVSGQTLLIVKGDTKINITSEGFMYARTNPDKLKKIIKEKVDALI